MNSFKLLLLLRKKGYSYQITFCLQYFYQRLQVMRYKPIVASDTLALSDILKVLKTRKQTINKNQLSMPQQEMSSIIKSLEKIEQKIKLKDKMIKKSNEIRSQMNAMNDCQKGIKFSSQLVDEGYKQLFKFYQMCQKQQILSKHKKQCRGQTKFWDLMYTICKQYLITCKNNPQMKKQQDRYENEELSLIVQKFQDFYLPNFKSRDPIQNLTQVLEYSKKEIEFSAKNIYQQMGHDSIKLKNLGQFLQALQSYKTFKQKQLDNILKDANQNSEAASKVIESRKKGKQEINIWNQALVKIQKKTQQQFYQLAYRNQTQEIKNLAFSDKILMVFFEKIDTFLNIPSSQSNILDYLIRLSQIYGGEDEKEESEFNLNSEDIKIQIEKMSESEGTISQCPNCKNSNYNAIELTKEISENEAFIQVVAGLIIGDWENNKKNYQKNRAKANEMLIAIKNIKQNKEIREMKRKQMRQMDFQDKKEVEKQLNSKKKELVKEWIENMIETSNIQTQGSPKTQYVKVEQLKYQKMELQLKNLNLIYQTLKELNEKLPPKYIFRHNPEGQLDNVQHISVITAKISCFLADHQTKKPQEGISQFVSDEFSVFECQECKKNQIEIDKLRKQIQQKHKELQKQKKEQQRLVLLINQNREKLDNVEKQKTYLQDQIKRQKTLKQNIQTIKNNLLSKISEIRQDCSKIIQMIKSQRQKLASMMKTFQEKWNLQLINSYKYIEDAKKPFMEISHLEASIKNMKEQNAILKTDKKKYSEIIQILNGKLKQATNGESPNFDEFIIELNNLKQQLNIQKQANIKCEEKIKDGSRGDQQEKQQNSINIKTSGEPFKKKEEEQMKIMKERIIQSQKTIESLNSDKNYAIKEIQKLKQQISQIKKEKKAEIEQIMSEQKNKQSQKQNAEIQTEQFSPSKMLQEQNRTEPQQQQIPQSDSPKENQILADLQNQRNILTQKLNYITQKQSQIEQQLKQEKEKNTLLMKKIEENEQRQKIEKLIEKQKSDLDELKIKKEQINKQKQKLALEICGLNTQKEKIEEKIKQSIIQKDQIKGEIEKLQEMYENKMELIEEAEIRLKTIKSRSQANPGKNSEQKLIRKLEVFQQENQRLKQQKISQSRETGRKIQELTLQIIRKDNKIKELQIQIFNHQTVSERIIIKKEYAERPEEQKLKKRPLNIGMGKKQFNFCYNPFESANLKIKIAQRAPKKTDYIFETFNGRIRLNFEQKQVIHELFRKSFSKNMPGEKNYIIAKTDPLFLHPQMASLNFHEFVDQIQNIIVIVKLINTDHLIVIYSEIPLSRNPLPSEFTGAFLAVIGNNEPGINTKTFYLNKKNPQARALVYNDYYLVIGNSDLRIKRGEKIAQSNIPTNFQYFETTGQKSPQFMFGVAERTATVEAYQIFSIQVGPEMND